MIGRVFAGTVTSARLAATITSARLAVTMTSARLAAMRPVTVTSARLAATRAGYVIGSPVKSLLASRQIHPTAVFCTTTPDDWSGSSTMAKTQALEMSVATLDDFQRVVNLCINGYNGVDYLPPTFPHLVDGPYAEGLLFKAGGDLVGFGSLLLVDRGRTAVFMAYRPQYSHQGQEELFSPMTHALLRRLSDQTLYPRVRRVLALTHSMHKPGSSWQLALTTSRTGRAFTASSLSQVTLKAPPREHVSALRLAEVTHLFQSDHARWSHLFPQQQFLVAMRPYTVMPDNVPVIQSSGWSTQFYGTTGADGRCSSLSAGSYHFCRVGVSYHVDLFGPVGAAGRRAVREHLVAHLQRLQTMGSTLPGTVVFDAFAEDTVEEEMAGVTAGLEDDASIVWDDDVMMLWSKDIRG